MFKTGSRFTIVADSASPITRPALASTPIRSDHLQALLLPDHRDGTITTWNSLACKHGCSTQQPAGASRGLARRRACTRMRALGVDVLEMIDTDEARKRRASAERNNDCIGKSAPARTANPPSRTCAIAWKHAPNPTPRALRSPPLPRLITCALALLGKAGVRISIAPGSSSLALSPSSGRHERRDRRALREERNRELRHAPRDRNGDVRL